MCSSQSLFFLLLISPHNIAILIIDNWYFFQIHIGNFCLIVGTGIFLKFELCRLQKVGLLSGL